MEEGTEATRRVPHVWPRSTTDGFGAGLMRPNVGMLSRLNQGTGRKRSESSPHFPATPIRDELMASPRRANVGHPLDKAASGFGSQESAQGPRRRTRNFWG